MTDEQETLLREPVFRYFHDICQVPRPSMREGQISDYLLNWALERGLEAQKDGTNNVLIRKPAAPGYEDAPCVMLQAHMDMVCEKAPGIDHDFDRDPIVWQIDEDRISTGGRTTLGADDGIGVAFVLAVLAEKELPHPELEVLFTTAEEEDFSGAANFDTGKMRADKIINLDHACDREILCGSCGGMAVELKAPVVSGPVPAGWEARQLTVSGLQGGHSGEDIHRGHGNASTFMVRVLLSFEEAGLTYRLGPVMGGSFRLAIPRDAHAVVCFPREQTETMEQIVREQTQIMKKELSVTGANLNIRFESVSRPDWCAEGDRFVTAAVLIPDGIYQMNESLVGLVDTSDNVGEMYLEENQLRMVAEIRSARPSLGNYLFQRMCRLAKLLGGTCEASKAYPSWEFHPQSQFREIAGQAYRTLFGEEPTYLTVHAGLEVGFLSEKKPELDAIAIGPDCWNFHSPTEQLSISSARKVYQFLCEVLKNCR